MKNFCHEEMFEKMKEKMKHHHGMKHFFNEEMFEHIRKGCEHFSRSAESASKGFDHHPFDFVINMMNQARESERANEYTKYATPELRMLFEEWLSELEEEILQYSRDKETISPDEISREFKLSRESAIFILGKLAQDDKINIKNIHLNTKDTKKEESNGNDGFHDE